MLSGFQKKCMWMDWCWIFFRLKKWRTLSLRRWYRNAVRFLFVPSCRVIYCILSPFFPPKSHQSYASRSPYTFCASACQAPVAAARHPCASYHLLCSLRGTRTVAPANGGAIHKHETAIKWGTSPPIHPTLPRHLTDHLSDFLQTGTKQQIFGSSVSLLRAFGTPGKGVLILCWPV